MQEETKSRLNHLARILRGLSLTQAGFILSDMSSDHHFELERLEYLGSRIFYPESILEELSTEHLAVLYKQLDPLLCAFLYQTYPELQTSLNLIIPGISKKKAGNFSTEEVILILQKTLSQLVSKGKISYNGKSLLFFQPDCKAVERILSSKANVEVINPILPAGSSVLILINAGNFAGQYVRISFQQSNQRFFSEENWFSMFQIDDRGMFYGELKPKHTEGPTSLWVEFPGVGEIHRTIYFSSQYESTFSIHLKSIYKDDTIHKGELELSHKKDIVPKEKIQIRLYCERCGSPLHYTIGNYINNSYHFQLPNKVFNSGHSKRIALYVEHGESTALKIIDKVSLEKPNILFQVKPPIESADSLEINEPNFVEKGGLYLCLYSHDRVTLLEHIKHFLAQPEQLEGMAKDNFQRNQNPLELSVLSGDLLLLNEKREPVYQKFYHAFDKNFIITLPVHGIGRVEPIYLVLLSWTNEWKVHKALEFPRLNENLISPELPDSLYLGEETEIYLYFKVKSKSSLKIISPRPENHSIEGKGAIRYFVRSGETLELEWENESKQPVRKEWKIQNKEWHCTEISLLQREKSNGENILSVEDMIQFLGQMYLEYKWICGEQVAARIVGLCSLLNLMQETHKSSILSRIQTAINTLLSYKNANGYYGIFSKETADGKTTRIIYSHLKLCLAYESLLKSENPKLLEIIYQIRKILGDENTLKVKGDFLFESLENEALVLKNTYLFLEKKEEQLHLYKSIDYFSKNAVATILLGLLYLHKQMDLTVTKSRKSKKEPIYRSGLIGLLEKWNIINPEYNIKTDIKLEKIVDGRSFLVENILFRYVDNSSLSTVELSSLWRLCLAVLEIKNQGEVALSFSKSSNLLFPESKTSSSLRISRFALNKGEYFDLELDQKKLIDKIVKIYYPYIVEPLEDSNFQQNQGEISFYPRFQQKTSITWKSIRKGKGKFFAILENPYNPSDFEFISVGEIKVS